MSYMHLSQDERYQVQHLHRGGFSYREIAKETGRHPVTIGREVRRNGDANDVYRARNRASTPNSGR